MKAVTYISFILILILGLGSCFQNTQSDKIIGIKTYNTPTDIASTITEWKNLKINTAFISKELAFNNDFVSQAIENDIDLFLIAPVFYNPKVLKEYPELYAVQQNGKIAKVDWVKFVCPSQKQYIENLSDSLSVIAKTIPLTGISLDFIRHFLFWEMIAPEAKADAIPNTCFCEHCIKNFEEFANCKIKVNNTLEKASYIMNNFSEKWSLFKQYQIEETVKLITTKLKSTNPRLKINLHAVPWTISNFKNAVIHKAGQNIKHLEKYCDYISPMLYHHMTHNSTDWIKTMVDSMEIYAPGKIIPSIQVSKAYRDDEISLEEFKHALHNALETPSNGVILWSWEKLNEDKYKKEILNSSF